ncbi:phytanoyl-CoA dioxygenase family protein [Microlunatus sp. GCM10028923]|uniref:phytanoyl-CoA dioxygenase family protein n=1 Tax=Microlunatus sp. GCM10028923 TaxID=3273400 RepID=UPI00361CA695
MINELTEEQRSLLPSDADVASYREQGFWISPVIVPDEVLDAAELGMRRLYAGESDRSLPYDVGGWTEADGNVLRKNDYASLRVDQLRELVGTPLIGATAARLAGVPEIRLWHDQLLYKPTDGPGVPGNVGWHTDRQYWQTCSSAEMLTAWVGFHDVDEDGGSVAFVAGSHRWDIGGLDFFSQDLAGLQRRAEEAGFAFDIRPTRMRRGQVSFHHCRTVHGSGPNRSGSPRRSIAVHLQPGDNRYVETVLPDGSVARHGNDRLTAGADGAPDYADPRFCPVLFAC